MAGWRLRPRSMACPNSRIRTRTRTWQPLPSVLPSAPHRHSPPSKSIRNHPLHHHPRLFPLEKPRPNHPSRSLCPSRRPLHPLLGTKLAQRWPPRPPQPAPKSIFLLQPTILRLRVQHPSLFPFRVRRFSPPPPLPSVPCSSPSLLSRFPHFSPILSIFSLFFFLIPKKHTTFAPNLRRNRSSRMTVKVWANLLE